MSPASVTGIIFEITAGLIFWSFILIVLSKWIKYLKKPDGKINRTKIIVFALLITSLPVSNTIRKEIEEINRRNKFSEYFFNKFNESERKELHEIILNTIRGPNYLTDDIRRKFWELINKYGYTANEIKEVEGSFVKAARYQKLLYNDALISLQTGTEYESIDRAELQVHLIALGGLSRTQLDNNVRMIKNVSEGDSVQISGVKYFFDNSVIEDMIDNLSNSERRVEELFSIKE